MNAPTHIIRTRRGLWFRAWRMVNIIRLRILIASNVNWLLACANDGILNTASVREVNRQTAELMAELLQWEQA